MSAIERSSYDSWVKNPNQEKYDRMYYRSLLPHIKGDVLDLGAGNGLFINEYISQADSVLAVDKHIKHLVPTEKMKVLELRLPAKIQTDKKFDTIVSTEFIEHIKREELEPLLKEVVGLLKKDGLFVGSTPNKIAHTTNEFHLYEYTLEELLSIFRKYFTEVEAWDNGQNCTIWKAKM